MGLCYTQGLLHDKLTTQLQGTTENIMYTIQGLTGGQKLLVYALLKLNYLRFVYFNIIFNHSHLQNNTFTHIIPYQTHITAVTKYSSYYLQHSKFLSGHIFGSTIVHF